MNAAVQTFVVAVTSVAAAAAIGVALGNRTAAEAAPPQRVAQAAQPAQAAVVVRLPRVVVEARRADAAAVTLAAARPPARAL